ncbi:MAG: hypothetical protein M1822_002223 [Bathelium mastoideum]|nr:MAG: hypothetical protein M1822_002223 [Bathelium mastoideum]
MPVIFSKTLVNIAPEDVGPEQQILLRRLPALTSREVILRAHTAVFWIWESIAYLDGANAALAIFFVLIGIDEPADWPPLFGNLAAATSLRKFWSDFWHRLATRPYRNYGREVARPLLGQKPQSILFKTVVAFVVFSLSGMTHAVVMWHAGVADWYLEITWFLLNFVGCLGETMYLSALRALAKHLGVSHELRKIEQSWFGYLTGYAWVFAFFFWSVPKWKYPRLERQAITVEKMQDFLANLGVSR